MTKPAWSKPVTQAVPLSGFPFARCVPTYVKLTIADRLGSQEPISNGLTCYARLKVNDRIPFGGNADALHTPVCYEVCIRPLSLQTDGNQR